MPSATGKATAWRRGTGRCRRCDSRDCPRLLWKLFSRFFPFEQDQHGATIPALEPLVDAIGNKRSHEPAASQPPEAREAQSEGLLPRGTSAVRPPDFPRL